MCSFLVKHDRKTKRLWFLWKNEKKNELSSDSGSKKGDDVKKCGCVGGCAFFGTNRSGDRFFWPSRKDWIDGVNVACFRLVDNNQYGPVVAEADYMSCVCLLFRVNKPGEDVGFGQSILKPSVLVFDTPPYTTQGASLLELHSELARDAIPKSGKAPYTFKPSLLADLSHTSSSVPSNRSDRASNVGSSQHSSTKMRRLSQPSQAGLKRQTRVHESAHTQSSDTRLSGGDEDGNWLRPGAERSSGRASSCCSDSKLGIEYFQSVDETEESVSTDESNTTLPFRSQPIESQSSALETEEMGEEPGEMHKKVKLIAIPVTSDI